MTHSPEQKRKKAEAMSESKMHMEHNVVGERKAMSEYEYNDKLKAGGARDPELENMYREQGEGPLRDAGRKNK